MAGVCGPQHEASIWVGTTYVDGQDGFVCAALAQLREAAADMPCHDRERLRVHARRQQRGWQLSEKVAQQLKDDRRRPAVVKGPTIELLTDGLKEHKKDRRSGQGGSNGGVVRRGR